MKNSQDSAKLIVSLDFELFWGMQDRHSLASYQDHVLGGRRAISQLLDLFEKHGIHATWATVGFMFADSYEELKRYFPDKDSLPSYSDPRLSPYRLFGEIGETEETAPCFYAPSLIRRIAQTPGQEIGSHTFSHYYCRERGQTIEQFRADMCAAVSIARDKGYTLRSVVLPRNQFVPEYNSVLRELGFLVFRDEENDWIHEKLRPGKLLRLFRLMDVYFPLTGRGGYLPGTESGLVNLPGSRMYKPVFRPLAFLEGLKIRRIKRQMLHAAKKGLCFHLWWHPHNVGVDTGRHLQQLEEIFSCYDELRERYGMRSLNMGEAAEEYLGARKKDNS